MRPRVILKTHSGVRRPGIFSVLVARCTSATRPTYQQNVTKRLAAEFQDVPREELKGAKLGNSAAFHALWMARPQQLGFLTPTLSWSWKGHVVRMLTSSDSDADAGAYLDLSQAEQVIYLKYYLEGDGAIIVALAREMLARGSLTEEQLAHSDLIEQLFRGIWEEYLNLTTNITERVGLRQKLKRERYDPGTRRHKTYPHLVPLEDMGLVVRSEHDNQDVFSPVVWNDRTSLQVLVEIFPTIRSLEAAIEHDEHYSILAEIMFRGHRKYSRQIDLDIFKVTVLHNYRKLRGSGAPVFAIDAIADASYAQMLANQGVLVTRSHIIDLFGDLQTQYPKEVRFHVDRRGLPAYVVIEDELVEQLLSA